MSNQLGSLKMGQKFKKTPAGELPVDWEVMPIPQVAEIVGGGTPERANPKYWGGEIFWATPTDVTSISGPTISKTKETISKEGLQNSAANLMPKGSVLMTSRATLGYAVVNTVPMSTNQGFINFNPSERINNYFLMYYLRFKAMELKRLAVGSTFLEIPKSALKSFFIPVPALGEQKKIAEIVLSIDALAYGLAREAVETRSIKTALMQKSFKCGVKTVKLAEICSLITKGSTPTTYGFKYTDSGVRFIKIESIRADGTINLAQTAHISEEANRAFKRSILESGDILFSIAGALGRTTVINEQIVPANTNQALAILRLKRERAIPQYVRYFLESDFVRKYVSDVGTQGAQANLSLVQVGGIEIPIPPLSIQQELADSLEAIDKAVHIIEYQCSVVENLKKAVMERLFTGKLRAN